ncbi:MAG: hypothetical protein KC593_13170 [Myxococcales bacterium]|nr:hypothetical protein [Myxococcales bacterium]MCB9629826.1 hypothetical protein [Sandaracinaceae bacterium]
MTPRGPAPDGACTPLHPTQRIVGPLAQMHRAQIERAQWPEFERFDAARYDPELRHQAARNWWFRARQEYGSVLEFSALLHALTRVGAPIELTGALGRLITDEARHAELCRAMTVALVGEERALSLPWEPIGMPYPPAPQGGAESAPEVLAWAADVLLTSCCIGEAVSRPIYDALIAVTTDAVPRDVVRQILRDEHLHASFGWYALEWLLPRLGGPARAQLDRVLAVRLGSFERTCSAGVALADLVDKELVIEPPAEDAAPNLGTLGAEAFAMIFYATIEHDILPRFEALGFDALRAWRTRHTE